MIWYDARTRKPVAPGEGEDGGPPSIDIYLCPSCGQGRAMVWWELQREMRCEVCETTLLFMG